jgi:hypothetical protein
VHFFAAVGSGGQITDTSTANFIGLFTGATTAPAGIDVFKAEIGAYTVPKCAMHAWRDGDLAVPYSQSPATPCSCKFDFATGNTEKPTSCATCAQDSDCSTGHCRVVGPPLDADAGSAANVGYCEVN